MTDGPAITIGLSYCGCNWLDDDAFDGGTTLCGCGEHHARGYRDTLFHHDGKHWRPECLIRHLADRVRVLEECSRKPGAIGNQCFGPLPDDRCPAVAKVFHDELAATFADNEPSKGGE